MVAADLGGRTLRMAARLWWSPVVAAGALVDRGSRARWLITPGIVTLAAAVSTVGKLVIRRPRPGIAMRVAPVGRLGAAGFPSTHATCAFAIAGWQRRSRGRWWLHLIAIGISYSRVRSGAHHYVDVAAGAALGYVVALRCDSLWSGALAPRFTERGKTHAADAARSQPRERFALPGRSSHRGTNSRSDARGAPILPRGDNGIDHTSEHLKPPPSVLEVA